MKAKTILMRYATAGVIAACVIGMAAKAPAQQATKKKGAAAKKEAKKAAAVPAMMAVPAIVQMEPRGMQRGTESRIRLTGTRLDGVTNVAFGNPKIAGELVSAGTTNEAVINVRIAADLPRGSYDLSVKGAHGESAKVKLHVDDLPQVYDVAGMGAKRKVEQLPVSFWGAIDKPGRVDHYEFNAKAGQTVVFELAAKSLGSKAAEAVITVVDPGGAVVASNSGFDDSSDALVAYRFPVSGTYSVRVSDLQLGASKDNFYRLSVGAFPYVTGIFPIGVPVNQETEVELAGYNLPAGLKAKVKAGMAGEVEVPIDGEKYRTRRAFKVLAVEGAELVEREPNDSPDKATPVKTISSVNGRMEAKGGPADEDFFRFEAKGGQTLVIETMAARRGSPIDTKIEVLHPDGKPVQRALLQATRDSYITFRGVDSNNPEIRVKNWEEMELNEYVYFQGEVNRILRMPRGPDSGFRAFTAGAKRISYFDTSATAHALDEPCYTVVAHPVGTKLVPNGLPQFPLYYANDDDGERKLGTDSRVHFTAPTDGVYLVRVTDSRGMGGDRYAYRLTLREAKPDFKVTLTGVNPTVEAGAGLGFSVRTERMDEFDDQIVVQIDGLPKGYSATTPLIIQAGHLEAVGSLFANLDAPKLTTEDWKKVQITAKATVAGKEVVQAVNNFGTVQLTASPKVFLSLQPQDKNLAPAAVTSAPEKPLEIVLEPGGKVPAWLRVVRNGDTNLVNLDIDNLPHGVIISDIGLNGVMVRAGETERPIFLEAARWVPEDERLCHVVSQSARAGAVGAGKQTSYPVLLKIRKPQAAANGKR